MHSPSETSVDASIAAGSSSSFTINRLLINSSLTAHKSISNTIIDDFFDFIPKFKSDIVVVNLCLFNIISALIL